MTPTGRPTSTAILQLCCVLAVALGIPSVVTRSSFLEDWLRLKDPKGTPKKRVMPAGGRVQDAASGRAELQKHRPDWVLIGNSMLHSRIENNYFRKLSGHRVYKLSVSSTKSAMWYLMLKQMVVQSQVKPKCVTIFFRDRDLTWPELRLHDNAEMIEVMNGRQEPEWNTVLGDYDEAMGHKTPVTSAVDYVDGHVQSLFPAASLRDWARNRIQKTAFDIGGFGDSREYAQRRTEVNEVFAMDHLRKTKTKASPIEAKLANKADELENVERLDFDPSPQQSFLPFMVSLAKENGIKLHFHRIKINPEIIPAPSESLASLPAYLDELQAYLRQNDCLYTDESVETGITQALYIDDVHIKTEAEPQQTYMNVFWRHVQPLIDGIMQVSGTSASQQPAS